MRESDVEKRVNSLRIVLVLAVLAFYWMSRTPFLTQPLLGEEGIFAHLMAAAPAGPDYGLMARVDGVAVTAPLDHPALMYEFYSRLGVFMRWVAPGAAINDIWARLLHSMFEALFWAFLAWQAASIRGYRWAAMGLLMVVGLTSPLGMAASVHLQTDNSSGLILAGALAWVLAQGGGGVAVRAALVLLSVVGKQEWALGAFGGLVAGECLNAWSGGDSSGWQKRLVSAAVAVGLGQVLSYSFDARNYAGGWRVVQGAGGAHHALAQGELWMALSRMRMKFIGGLILLMGLAGALAWRAPKERKHGEWAAFGVALALFAPYALSTWNPSPRYFTPAWAACMALLASQALHRDIQGKGMAWLNAAGLLLVLWQSLFLYGLLLGRRSITEYAGYPVAFAMASDQRALALRKDACLPFLSSGYAWSKEVDFVGNGLSPEAARIILGEAAERVCPPEAPQP